MGICDEDSVKVVIRHKDEGPRVIKDLTFDVKSAHLVTSSDGLQEVYVIVKVFFTEPANWLVKSNLKPTPLPANEPFLLMARFRTPIATFELTALGPKGEKKSEKFVVVTVIKKGRNKFNSDLFLGLSQTNYEEESRTSFKQTSLTAGVNLIYFLRRPDWSVEGGIFSDTAVITSNATTYSSKFLTVGGQLNYAVSLVPTWGLKLSLGLFSPVMIGKNGEFGYSTFFIPRLYPLVTKRIGKRDIYGYFRYMPLGQSGEVDSGFGIGWILNRPEYRRWIFAVDYSDLQFRPTPAVTVKMNSLAFRIGYGF